jgi:hypothetical protein
VDLIAVDGSLRDVLDQSDTRLEERSSDPRRPWPHDCEVGTDCGGDVEDEESRFA